MAKKPFSQPIEAIKEPFEFEKVLPFCTDFGTFLQMGTFDLFYKFDASYIAYVRIHHDLIQFVVPSVELMMPADRLRVCIKNSGLHPEDSEGGTYLVDLLTEKAIWNVHYGYPEAPEYFNSLPTPQTNTTLSILMAGYGGDIVKTDAEGFFQEVAYLKDKMSSLSSSGKTSLFGLRLLMRAWVRHLGLDIPDSLLERYQTYFEPKGSIKSSWVPSGDQLKNCTQAFASYDIDMEQLPLEDGELIDASFEDEEDDALYDGRITLSKLLENHPSKWAVPQARIKVVQDIVMSFQVSKIICQNQMLFFHVDEKFRMSPLLVAKELGIPNTYAQHIMVI